MLTNLTPPTRRQQTKGSTARTGDFDLLKIAVVYLRLAEEVKIRHPTLIIAHVNRVRGPW